jgi:hypothetical protein
VLTASVYNILIISEIDIGGMSEDAAHGRPRWRKEAGKT